jgi:RNA polymerase sigma-70 factor (ECF subfamily)
MAQPDQDADLPGRIAAGDESALRELFSRYGQRLYAYALRLTDDPALADDGVQLTLVAVWQGAGRFRGEGRVLAWLLGILHHTTLKLARGKTLPISDAMEDTLTEPSALPEEKVLEGELSSRVRDGLRELSPEHRAALELVFYQELSLAEAAQVCGCPVGTIKSRLSYARRCLRGRLERLSGEELR